MLNNQSVIRPHGQVAGRSVPERFALLKLREGHIYLFNQEMEHFWRQIQDGVAFVDLVAALDEDGHSETDRAELADFLNQLAAVGLVELLGEDESVLVDQTFLDEDYCQTVQYQNYCSQENIIYSALIELTNHCNLRCIHCYHDEEQSVLELADLENLLAELKEMGTMEIIYTGGEVFLREEFLELVQKTVEMGFFVNFLTNGTLLTPEQLTTLPEIDFCILKTSLYGVTAEVHDQVTGVQGSYQATIQMLKDLQPLGRKVMVNYVVMKQNYHQVREAQKLVTGLGAEIRFDYKIFPTRQNSEAPLERYLGQEELAELFASGLVSPLTELNCLAGKSKVRVDYAGNIYPCEYLNLALGNIRTDSIIQIWTGQELGELRNQIRDYLPSECGSCESKENCLRCPALVWNQSLYADEKHPIMCYQAEASRLAGTGKF